MELRTATEYSHIDQLHYLAQGHLLPNEYLSIDYPADMNLQYQKEFVEKSIANNWKYQSNPQYICAIQYDWMAQKDFEFRIKELEPIYAYKKKIVALGNLCRIMRPNKYFDFVINYLIKNKAKFYWVHIYGMALACIKKYIPLLQLYAPEIQISVDSTKWTRPCKESLKRKYMKPVAQRQLPNASCPTPGLGCTKDTRDEFFLTYINEIKKRGIRVDY
jgi:hypothetical protein